MPDVDDFKAKANTYHHSSRPDKLLHFVYYIPSLTGAKLQTPPQVADRGTTCRYMPMEVNCELSRRMLSDE